MAWTRNRVGRRDAALRQRPTVEPLDDRCLLSTTAGAAIAHPLAHAHAQRRAVLLSRTAGRAQSALNARRELRHRNDQAPAASLAVTVERPAGTTSSTVQASYDPIIGAAQARATYGVDGRGMTVAVIDTGIDYQNPALGGAFGAGAKVVAGFNFVSNTTDPMATASQHGTAVAGLIGSKDASQPGVAPGVNLVALRVVGDNNSAQLSNIARALQWVVDNHTQYNITAVNMSLSDGGNYAQNWFAHDGGVGQHITDLVGQLKALNIPVISATGNSFKGQQGEGFTSIVDGVISVTATDTSNQLLPDAQRLGADIGNGNATEIAAPGKGLLAPSGANQVVTVDGTSFAAPLVTGSVVLLQQIYQSRFGSLPTVEQLTGWLEKGADPIYDSVTGITIGQLDVAGAAALIPAAPTPATPAPTTPQVPVSYEPVVTPSAPAAQQLTPPASTTTTTTTAPQVYVNGRAVNASGSSTPSMLSSLSQSRFESLVRAMSAWANQGKGGTGQVRLWGAAAKQGSGVAYPTGRLALLRLFRASRLAGR